MASLFDQTKGIDDIGEIYRQIERNCPNPSSNSKKLWVLRRKTNIDSRYYSDEKMLERAVAMLAYIGHMPGWFNECPTASGFISPHSDKRSNVDLVHWSETNGHARIVELKWRNNTPSEALRQVLRYGAAYIFCRVHRDKLPVRRSGLMEARRVSLQVAAPALYYTEQSLPVCLSRMRDGLKHFATGSKIEGLSMSLDVLAFPEWFDVLPFSNGTEVSETCNRDHLTEEGQVIRDAFDGLTSVNPE